MAGLDKKSKEETIVYSIEFPNTKRYIGITCRSLEYRMYEHESRARCGQRSKLYDAMRKYSGSYKPCILEVCESYDLAKILESVYIEELETFGKKGYNLTLGGDGNRGYRPSEETRRKLSESHKGYKMPESQKRNISKGNRGKIRDFAMKIKKTNIKTGEVKLYAHVLELEKEGFKRHSIYSCVSGKRNSLFGYVFERVT
jgi:group I intron endonuclease